MARSRTKTPDTPARRLLRRVLWAGGGLLLLVFAIEGGEYGTTDLFSQKSRRAALEAEVVAMRAEVDSLEAELKAVTSDNARLERIARERYGMVKGDKELLYWTRSADRRDGADSAVADTSTTP